LGVKLKKGRKPFFATPICFMCIPKGRWLRNAKQNTWPKEGNIMHVMQLLTTQLWFWKPKPQFLWGVNAISSSEGAVFFINTKGETSGDKQAK
jgi:hypothetical protein